MEFNISQINSNYNFTINGASYAGKPVSGTAMFVTKKVEHLLENLKDVSNCLVFVEDCIVPDEALKKDICFVGTINPQLEYAKFMTMFFEAKVAEERKLKYRLTEEGYYIGENVVLGDNCYIEPTCIIGHGVVIGNNARILAGSVIKNSVIGDNFLCNEGAIIGANGFTISEDESGNKFRIPTLGKVIIGDNVEIGTQDNISCGSGGNTIIEDYVKIDTLVHIGHDAHLYKNVEITAGAIVGGFAEVREKTYIGINSTIRNRIALGENSRISMGAAVTKSVEPNQTVTGNFAISHERFISQLKEQNKLYNRTNVCEGGAVQQ